MTTDIGRVTSVVPAPEEKRIYVSVKLSPEEYVEEIPFATGKTGLWMVPEEGDIVEVYEVGFESYVARTPHNPTPLTMPDLSQGDFCLKLNEDTELTFSKQTDDTYDLHIKTDGRLSIEAEGGFDLVDKDGYGIVSEDSAGDFTWYHNNVDFDNTGTATLNG